MAMAQQLGYQDTDLADENGKTTDYFQRLRRNFLSVLIRPIR